MNKEELAKMINGREYGNEITKEIEQIAKDNKLVIVFGYSDDGMEFRGAIEDEFGCCDGGTVYLTKLGLLEECECDCTYYQDAKKNAKIIEAVWCPEGSELSWAYETDIPHSCFEILEDGEPYCEGIVFRLEDL